MMDLLIKELENIDEDVLSPEKKIKKKHLIKLANICGKIRIIDSQNLKQVFDMYKQPTVKF